MKEIDLIVPTRNRPQKLLRMIKSVPEIAEGVPINIILGFDDDQKTEGRFSGFSKVKKCVQFNMRIGSIAIRNKLISQSKNAVLYAVDDIVFEKGAIESAIRSMRSHFPDDNGVVGFKVIGDKIQCKAGVGLAGNTFLQSYPGRNLFYPGYFHFGAQEVERAATIRGRLYFDENARIIHFHPAHYPKERDKTHTEARTARAADFALSSKRRIMGLTWGING